MNSKCREIEIVCYKYYKILVRPKLSCIFEKEGEDDELIY